MSAQPNIDEVLRIHKLAFGSARMETEDPGGAGGAGGTGGNPPVPDPNPNPDEKQLPQSRVNEIVASETAKAKAKALEDLAKELGVSVEDAKRIVKERKEADDKNATDLQRAESARVAAETDRDTKVSASQVELHAERADRALVAAGVPDEDEKLERLRGMLTVKVGATRDEIREDVKKLKEQFPPLFDGAAPKGPPRRTDPQRKQGSGQLDSTSYDRGLERAKGAKSEQDTSVPRPAIPGVPVQPV